jgi:hypothetical protein
LLKQLPDGSEAEEVDEKIVRHGGKCLKEITFKNKGGDVIKFYFDLSMLINKTQTC